MTTETTDVNPDPGCHRATDPDMTLSINLGTYDTMALGGSTGHPDLYDPGCSMTPRLQRSHILQPKPWATVWNLVAKWTMNFNTDRGCSKTTDPDMVPNYSLGLTVTMALSSRAMCHSDVYSSDCSMILGHQNGPRWLIRPWANLHAAFSCNRSHSVNSDPGCCRPMDPDMDLESNLSLDNTRTPGSNTGHTHVVLMNFSYLG